MSELRSIHCLCSTRSRRMTCLSLNTWDNQCIFSDLLQTASTKNKSKPVSILQSRTNTCRTSRTTISVHILFLTDGQFHRNLALIQVILTADTNSHNITCVSALQLNLYHKMAWVGRDIYRSSSPLPCHHRGTAHVDRQHVKATCWRPS